MLFGEILDDFDNENDFIGHAGGDNFVIISSADADDAILKTLKERFKNEILTHYNFMDRQQGYITATNENGKAINYPLMTLSIGKVSPKTHTFADIREITELAAEARRLDNA